MSALSNVKLYYPQAREWMWDYCIYLGPYTDKNGANYDLGAYCSNSNDYSAAIVYGNEPGEYLSGDLATFNRNKDLELYNEIEKRLKALGLM